MKYEKTKNIAFPIGGIGTGCISLMGNGELNDWEIFNKPCKNTRFGYAHFAIKAVSKDKTVAKVLHGDTNENFIGTRDPANAGGFDFGPRVSSLAGFPHFKKVEFEGSFPIANLLYQDDEFPANVRLCAFNPLIPHDDFNSSLPAAFFEWEIENTASEEIEYAIAFSSPNPSGAAKNEALENGCFLSCRDKTPNELGYNDLTILTDNDDTAVQANWYHGAWQDGITTYWNDFTKHARMPKRAYPESWSYDHASVATYTKLQAGEKKKIRFVLAWSTPIQYNYWSPYKDENGNDITWKNYYATKFETSLKTAKYALENFENLLNKTKRFSDALQNSALPDFVIDAVSANLSVLKSPTVLRLEDGSFWGWEGVHDRIGLCEGSCQHVWNYAYALPFLFPNLERSMRENTMKYGIFENGETTFRIPLPLGRTPERHRACVDGQMGEVIKCYREWKISGDNEWLKEHADTIFKMLEYAWEETNGDAWDKNCDGVIDGRQHHTLDMELFSANSWLEGFYLLALDCASKMAEALGDTKRVEKYRSLYENGRAWTNEHLFNGEYFQQTIDLKDKSILDKFEKAENYWNDEANEIKYQIADGCSIDQMLADWHAAILGLDGVFDTDKKQTALKSLYKYNFNPSMRSVVNTFRNFALNDEAGTVICSYPDHKYTPALPILYLSETMTGFEYAFGGLLLSQGFITESETVVKAVRDRYDGEKRNPWSEIECGHHYARSMASYALLLLYSGFTFDMTKGYIGFQPISTVDGSYFWSVGKAYGNMQLSGNTQTLSVFDGELVLSAFGLRNAKRITRVRVDGQEIAFEQKENRIEFTAIQIRESLEIQTA